MKLVRILSIVFSVVAVLLSILALITDMIVYTLIASALLLAVSVGGLCLSLANKKHKRGSAD